MKGQSGKLADCSGSNYCKNKPSQGLGHRLEITNISITRKRHTPES